MDNGYMTYVVADSMRDKIREVYKDLAALHRSPSLNRIENVLTDICSYQHYRDMFMQDDLEKQNRHYPYISLRYEEFVSAMDQISRIRPKAKTFIDVGCGIGDKVFIANLLGYEASGIEYNEHTHKVAVDVLGKQPGRAMKIHRGDANQFSFAGYDVIYMYHPIADGQIMRKLFDHVVETADEGAVICEALPRYLYDILKSEDRQYTRATFTKRNGKLWLRRTR